ncbi:MAG TPA: 50S ribosomal protein L21 [candidate division Zixibacteria bacterium]|nr:50S ribosomal protein L21 [candidate division Zixibacteria bacterium]
MLAVFKVGGHQFKAEKGDVLKVSKLKLSKGDKLEIKEVLMLRDKDEVIVGSPYVANAAVEAEVVGEGKDDKVLIYKYKRRTKYRRTQGHRQDFTEIKINKIKKAD